MVSFAYSDEDEKLTAFSIGEQFKDDMAIIHIEKADPDVQGAYPMINREFARAEWSEVEYINREEDMGIEGLRKAKLSYNPVFLIEKYTLREERSVVDIRLLEKEDIPQAKALWKEAFADSDAFINWYFAHKVLPSILWLI